MQEQIFSYNGKELIDPLERLLKSLIDHHKNVNDELASYKAAKPKTPRVASLQKDDPYLMSLSSLERDRVILENDIKKANNWLRECRRTPKREFKVDFQDLAWLYREKNIS